MARLSKLSARGKWKEMENKKRKRYSRYSGNTSVLFQGEVLGLATLLSMAYPVQDVFRTAKDQQRLRAVVV